MMATAIRIMPCLDMKAGRVVKGVHFVNLRDAGDPVECARAYCDAGADELAMLDIMATVEHRKTMVDVVRKTAKAVTVPFTVGGGIASVADMRSLLDAGATSVSISSAAFRRPELIAEAVAALGGERIVVAIDADRNPSMPSGYEVYVDGGRTATGSDCIEFARKAESLGAGMLLPTSRACDGAKTGYDIPLTRGIAEAVRVPVVASGGAGTMEHFLQAAVEGKARVLLAASVFHFGLIRIPELKTFLRDHGVLVRM
jgi:imidazole glycerol-phosphate synthase subunit HisF